MSCPARAKYKGNFIRPSSSVSFVCFSRFCPSPLLMEHSNCCLKQRLDINTWNVIILSEAYNCCCNFGTSLRTADVADQKLLQFPCSNFCLLLLKGLPNSERPRSLEIAALETPISLFEAYFSWGYFGTSFTLFTWACQKPLHSQRGLFFIGCMNSEKVTTRRENCNNLNKNANALSQAHWSCSYFGTTFILSTQAEQKLSHLHGGLFPWLHFISVEKVTARQDTYR